MPLPGRPAGSSRPEETAIIAPDLSTDSGALVRRLLDGALADVPDAALHDLLDAVRAELARRDVQALVDGLRRHLSPESSDHDVRELVAEHGPALTVLFVAEEWETGHMLGPDADVTFSDGTTENLDLRRLQPQILEVSAVHAPVGYAAEYRIDLRTGTGTFAPIGFGDPLFPPGMRSPQPE